MHTATLTNLIPVIPSHNPGDKRRLTISVPEGWNDVKKLCKKVLAFEGRNYVFRGWNSDRNECFFIESENFAAIK